MTEPSNQEEERIVGEWKQRAQDDLDSSEILLNETNHYEIAAYHAHQAIEKILKATLLKRGEMFKFTHDLEMLFHQVFIKSKSENLFDKVSFVNSLYPMLRYPTGDRVTEQQAERCLEVAKTLFDEIKKVI